MITLAHIFKLKPISNSDVKDICLETTPSEAINSDYYPISLQVTGFGFGIAVSGGTDNPHF